MSTEKPKLMQHKINNKLIPKMSWIKFDGDPILRKKSLPVTSLDEKDYQIIDQMVSYIDACYEEKYEDYQIRPGIAVAAPQMGLNKRMIYLHFEYRGNEYQYFLINPQIVSYSDAISYVDNGEGCLSVPQNVDGNVPRNYKIIVEGYDLLTQQNVEIVAKDLLSICLQHEIDHLDGILYHDRIDKQVPNFKNKDWIKI